MRKLDLLNHKGPAPPIEHRGLCAQMSAATKGRETLEEASKAMFDVFEKHADEWHEVQDILTELQGWCLNQAMKAKSQRAIKLISNIEHWAEEKQHRIT